MHFQKHPYAMLTYKKRQIKHLKHASKVLTKTLENHCKHTHYPDKTLATYA
jgi:hypothetical protein